MAGRKQDSETDRGGLSRRALIATSAGVATTAAVTAVSPAAAAAMGRGEAPPVRVTPSTPIPEHPIVAYVHHAGRGEVTIVSGKGERTYRDAALVKRLTAAAKSHGV